MPRAANRFRQSFTLKIIRLRELLVALVHALGGHDVLRIRAGVLIARPLRFPHQPRLAHRWRAAGNASLRPVADQGKRLVDVEDRRL